MRFFERVKIERSLAKLEKQAKLHAEGGGPFSDEERGKLAQLKDDLQVDIWRGDLKTLSPKQIPPLDRDPGGGLPPSDRDPVRPQTRSLSRRLPCAAVRFSSLM